MGRCKDKNHDCGKDHDKNRHCKCKPRNRKFLNVKARNYNLTQKIVYVSATKGRNWEDDEAGGFDTPYASIDYPLELGNNNYHITFIILDDSRYVINADISNRSFDIVGHVRIVGKATVKHNALQGNYAANAVLDNNCDRLDRVGIAVNDKYFGRPFPDCVTIPELIQISWRAEDKNKLESKAGAWIADGRFYNVRGNETKTLQEDFEYPLYELKTEVIFATPLVDNCDLGIFNLVGGYAGLFNSSIQRGFGSIIDDSLVYGFFYTILSKC